MKYLGEKRYGKSVAFETVQAAIQGDVDSINQVYMKRRVEIKLITKILDFKIRS